MKVQYVCSKRNGYGKLISTNKGIQIVHHSKKVEDTKHFFFQDDNDGKESSLRN